MIERIHHLLGDCFHHSGARGPGATAFTRTPSGPYSAAQAFVNSSRAARLAPYRAMPGCPKLATIVETLTMEPHPRVRPWLAPGCDKEEGNLDVQCNALVEVCFGGCIAWSELGDTSVIDEDVDMAVAHVGGPLNQVVGRFEIAQRRELVLPLPPLPSISASTLWLDPRCVPLSIRERHGRPSRWPSPGRYRSSSP